MTIKLHTARNKKGFTMIELLVSMSIFMVFIGLSASSYIGLMKANQHASEMQQTYRDIRHVFDTIADEVHNNQIDYNCFALNNGDADCIQNGTTPNVIAFTSSDKEFIYRRLYSFSDGTVKVKNQKKLPNDLSWATTADAVALTSEQTKFSDVSFSFFPLKNPYDSENVADATVQWQPSVSISITKASSTVGTPQIYKTTFSSRSYGTKSLYTPHIEIPKFNASQFEFKNTFTYNGRSL